MTWSLFISDFDENVKIDIIAAVPFAVVLYQLWSTYNILVL